MEYLNFENEVENKHSNTMESPEMIVRQPQLQKDNSPSFFDVQEDSLKPKCNCCTAKECTDFLDGCLHICLLCSLICRCLDLIPH